LNDFHFPRALIPYNPRNESSLKKVGHNEYGYPTCPNDSSLAMKYLGTTKKGRTDRIKWDSLYKVRTIVERRRAKPYDNWGEENRLDSSL